MASVQQSWSSPATLEEAHLSSQCLAVAHRPKRTLRVPERTPGSQILHRRLLHSALPCHSPKFPLSILQAVCRGHPGPKGLCPWLTDQSRGDWRLHEFVGSCPQVNSGFRYACYQYKIHQNWGPLLGRFPKRSRMLNLRLAIIESRASSARFLPLWLLLYASHLHWIELAALGCRGRMMRLGSFPPVWTA